jgi:hypothetical protein
LFLLDNKGNLEIMGKITATSGTIGTKDEQGKIFINNDISVGGEGSSSNNQKDTYFIKGSTKANGGLNLADLPYGLRNNLFYLGEGGLVFKNPAFDGQTDSLYRGIRITSSGILLEGNNQSIS